MDELREMRLELLQKFYENFGEVRLIGEGSMVARADYHHQDEVYVGTNSANIWKLQDHEVTYFFSGEALDHQEYEANYQAAVDDAGEALKPHKKLRSAVMTLVMVYDRADPDVLDEVRAHSHKVYHKYSLNGWTIHRLVLILTDTQEIVTDKRASKLVRRFNNVISL